MLLYSFCKCRNKEVKFLAPGHATNMWPSQDSNPAVTLNPCFSSYTTCLYFPHEEFIFPPWSINHKLKGSLANSRKVFRICSFLNSSVHSTNVETAWYELMRCLTQGDSLSLTELLGFFVSSLLTCEETSHRSGGRQSLPDAPSRFLGVQDTLLDAGSVHHQRSVGISCRWV